MRRMNWPSSRPLSSSGKVGAIVGTMTVGAAPAGTGVAIIGAEVLVGAARSDGAVGIDRFTGPELIAQAATARVSTVQAAIAREVVARQVVAREETADDRSPLVLAFASCTWPPA